MKRARKEGVMISIKEYRCINCNKTFSTSTNHYGNIYGCSPCCRSTSECIINEDGSVKAPNEFKQIKKGVRNIERMQTKSKPFPQWSKGARITVKYGFRYLQGNSHPYFSITADITTPASRRRHDIDAGGCLHDEIKQAFPELSPLLKWHGVNDNGETIHYVANATYWLMEFGIRSKWKSDGKVEPLDAFKSAVVFGALPEDTSAALSALLAPLDPDVLVERVRAFCANRLPALAAKMREDMEAFGVQYIEQSEYMNSVA